MTQSNRKGISALVAAGFIAGTASNAFGAAVTRYVDASVSSSGNGQSWATAKKTIQEAVGLVLDPGSVIKVAHGRYYPTIQSTQIDLGSEISIQGGYRGNNNQSLDPNDRDLVSFETILSGDIGANDNDNPPVYSDNAYHVVSIPPDTQPPPQTGAFANRANLDGVTISAGRSPNFGGGIYADTDDEHPIEAVIRDCKITMNTAGDGAGCFASAYTDLTFRHCTFYQNVGEFFGGGAYTEGAMRLLNCDFVSNSVESAGSGGGVAAFTGSTLKAHDCAFVSNSATPIFGEPTQGGGVFGIIGTVSIYQRSKPQ